MSPNPLKEDTHPQEVKKGESITNLNTQKAIKFLMPDGSIRTIISYEKHSGPVQDGHGIDSETTYLVFDPAGNPMPLDPGKLILSHSGFFIPTPEQRAICTSIFHRTPNRNIFIGQDGYLLGDGRAVCVHCQSIRTTIFIVSGILGIGIFWGLLKALRIMGLM